MADVNISYKGNTIAELDGTGSKTLKTGGCYCEGDIAVTYTPRVDDSFRRWDITITDFRDGVYANILQDDWLKNNRANSHLCVAVVPNFTIEHDAECSRLGIYLCANAVLMRDVNGAEYRSVGSYVHKGGTPVNRARSFGLTNANDVGDLNITASGQLQAISYSSHLFAPGEYSVIAFLM